MEYLPEAAGPHDPVRTTLARAAGSVRRTSHIDTARPDGLFGPSVVDARARDLATGPNGATTVLAEARLEATVVDYRLTAIRTEPEVEGLEVLVGTSPAAGFRARLAELLGEACPPGSPLYLLLDDLPGATLVSGYAVHSGGGLDNRPPPDLSNRGDLCAGWATDASMVVHIRQSGTIPVPVGPRAPRLERADDAEAWHAMGVLGPHTVRRRRRLDLYRPADSPEAARFDLHFRDSHADGERLETIMHEYTVTGTVDLAARRLGEVVARAQVLPWLECPGAVASAQRVAGMALDELRLRVRREFVGRTTCTHLNDSLRSLADLGTLASALDIGVP
jgi:hypothetical protein